MDEKKPYILLVGNALKDVAVPPHGGYTAIYLEDQVDLFHYLKDRKDGRYTTILHFSNEKAVRGFYSCLKKEHPGMFFSIPLIAWFSGFYPEDTAIFSIFDYSVFQRIDTDNVLSIIQHACMLKKNLKTLEIRVRERTKDLEDFVYTVSHDLKSPLHAARGFADMVKRRFEPCIRSDDDRFIVRRIEENINQSIKMIDDLLTLSRLGTREPRFEKVDLAEIIQDYFIQLNALKKDEVKVAIELDEKLPEITADRARMVQVFTNIIDNAVKSRKGDNVKIRVAGKTEQNRVTVTVEDNGAGIDERDLPHIFDIFYRGSLDGEKSLSEESGVGLTIVKKIVEQHNGKIEIKSAPFQGTTVTIDFPINR